jgi:hypothetical protein
MKILKLEKNTKPIPLNRLFLIMENPQEIEYLYKSSGLFAGGRIRNCSFLRKIVLECADCKERLAYNVPFITAIPRFVIFGLLPFPEKVRSGVGIGFVKALHF